MSPTTSTSSLSSTSTSERSTSSTIRLHTLRPEASTSTQIEHGWYCSMPPSATADVSPALANVVELPVRHDYSRLVEQLARRNEALDDFAALGAQQPNDPVHA